MRDAKLLAELQAMPLTDKIEMTQERIDEWYTHWDGQVYVSISGGKDSMVLLDIVRSIHPDVPAVFIATGLESPEVQRIARSAENAVTIRPKMSFREVLMTKGYPVISKEVATNLNRARRLTTRQYREQLRGGVRVSLL